MMTETPVATVKVLVSTDGSNYFLRSDDVPGLHVWGNCEQDLQERVIKAIQAFKWNKGIDVDVFPENYLAAFPDTSIKRTDSFVVAASTSIR